MSIYDKASLVQIPSGYKSGTLYSVVPNDADGDFDYSGGTNGTRVNKDGLIETVAVDTPRLNYPLLNGVVQSNPTLLLEPSRTNRITDTEGWGGFSEVQAVLSNNTSITAPDGSTLGIKTLTSSSTTQPRIEWRGIAVPASATTYVWSVFVKKGTTRYVALSHFSDDTQWAVFDLDNGVIQDEAGSDVPAKIENYGNGWYRISKGATITTGQSTNYFKLTIATPSSPSVGVSGETVNIWGFQIEIGLYVSSFIPTTTVGSITTRGADDCVDAQADFNDAEGVLYVNAKINDPSDADDNDFSLGDGSFISNSVEISFRNPLGLVQTIVGKCAIDGSTLSLTNTTITDQSIKHDLYHKVAYQYKQADFKMFVNGFKIGTSTYNDIFASGVLSRVSFEGNGTSSTKFRGETKELMTFNSAMTDIELETLTSYRSFNSMAKELLFTIE